MCLLKGFLKGSGGDLKSSMRKRDLLRGLRGSIGEARGPRESRGAFRGSLGAIGFV